MNTETLTLIALRVTRYARYLSQFAQGLEAADVEQQMWLALLEREAVDPTFTQQKDAYMLGRAVGYGRTAARASRTYSKYVNVGLRKLFDPKRPLIYFHGIIPGLYLAIWPVFIVGDDPQKLTFTVAVDEMTSVQVDAPQPVRVSESTEARRIYLTAVVRQRLHQRSFREKVLLAYRSQCAFCLLRHRELLDAAHIIPHRIAESRPTVDNGLALCKLHHAAFDSFMLGVSPDYVIHVRMDILKEIDGPILKHGFQDLHKTKLLLPSQQTQWPDRDSLAWKFERFTKA